MNGPLARRGLKLPIAPWSCPDAEFFSSLRVFLVIGQLLMLVSFATARALLGLLMHLQSRSRDYRHMRRTTEHETGLACVGYMLHGLRYTETRR